MTAEDRSQHEPTPGSMRWLRVHSSLLDNPKAQRLPGETFKQLINLWCLAAQCGGWLPPPEDIAFRLRLRIDRVASLIETLCAARLLDQIDGRLRPHDWDAHQYRSDVSTARVRAFRERQAKRFKTVSVTAPDTETESETEADTERTLTRDDEAFSLFWSVYPNKVGKAKAREAFIAITATEPHEPIIAGVRRYAATKPADRYWMNPTTFLVERRWEDAPAVNGAGVELRKWEGPEWAKDKRQTFKATQ